MNSSNQHVHLSKWEYAHVHETLEQTEIELIQIISIQIV